ncbi:MAG TPA: choice-of-anchor tandem repeat GloVer-containing protein [Candidatus Baltobacteraceae bacterium]|nr:choice-of-anchor tandem repeat GloVer-containing protein [Candidatus Baltobacteraceae bacterium]
MNAPHNAVPESAQAANAGATFTVLHTFTGAPDDGFQTFGQPAVTTTGYIFGTTAAGGTSNFGIAYELHGPLFKVLHSFTKSAGDGGFPSGKIVLNAAGGITVTTNAGGATNQGAIESVGPLGKTTVLHSFNFTDGAGPDSGVIADSSGTLFGTASAGGNNSFACQPIGGCGTVFSLDPKTRKLTVLHVFNERDGALPLSAPVLDAAGNLYGVAQTGGPATNPCQFKPAVPGCGVVFKIDRAGHYNIVHAFNNQDGEFPLSLTRTQKGQLYGATFKGGSTGLGVVFAIDPSGHETTLHTFTGGADGEFPDGLVLFDGKIFGFAAAGGTNKCKCGTIFELDPATKKLTTLHTFGNGADGSTPTGALAVDAQGDIFGNTFAGGDVTKCSPPLGCGTLFEIKP